MNRRMRQPDVTNGHSTRDAGLAVASVDITPDGAVPLAGWANRRGSFEGVADPLEANLAILRGNEKRVAFVSVDLLYVGELRERVLARTNLHPDELFFAASHTHFGPATDSRLAKLGEVDETYLDGIAQRIADRLRELREADPIPVRIEYRETVLEQAVNRRRRGWMFPPRGVPKPGILMRPDPAGRTDARARVLTLRDPKDRKRVRACIWSYSCHPVCFPAWTKVSAEFPGFVRLAIRERYGTELPVLFFQGFAGNLRPRVLRRPRSVREHLGTLLNGPAFGVFDQPGWNRWAGEIARQILAAMDESGAVIGADIEVKRMEVPLSSLFSEYGGQRSVSFHRVTLGNALDLVGLSAEPMVEHLEMIDRLSPMSYTIPVGYIDSVFGYLPTTAMAKEGGYEGRDFLDVFGFRVSSLSPDEAKLESLLRQLLQER